MKILLRTKNPSAASLRGMLRSERVATTCVVRLGSRTPIANILRPGARYHEINTIASIENSRDKLLMKSCFARSAEPISQSEWFTIGPNRVITNARSGEVANIARMNYPLVAKRVVGFKAHGMQKLDNQQALEQFLNGNTSGYYLEEFKNFAREYRIHATPDGAFLSWRKMRRQDAENRWFFNSSNCNWISEENELFQRPAAWDLMCQHAARAIAATGLTIGAVDVRCKSNAANEGDFIVLEVNSAPELGEVGTVSYFNKIVEICRRHQ